MISRHWSGLANREHAEAYVNHLRTETIPSLHTIPGFIHASVLCRSVYNAVEFLVITEWDSLEAIRAFTGENVEEAVVPEIVREMMIEYDQKVRHYEVVM